MTSVTPKELVRSAVRPEPWGHGRTARRGQRLAVESGHPAPGPAGRAPGLRVDGAREEAFGEEVWRSRIADSAQFLAFAPATISGEAVIGTGTGFVDPAHPGEVRLVAMFVVPAARGRGVASRLLDAVVTDARERGFDRVVLDVVESNAAAHRCYVRYGFRPTGATRPLPHAPELTEIEMELPARASPATRSCRFR